MMAHKIKFVSSIRSNRFYRMVKFCYLIAISGQGHTRLTKTIFLVQGYGGDPFVDVQKLFFRIFFTFFLIIMYLQHFKVA